MPALAAWAVIPFAPGLVLANVNAGLLYVMAITSVGVYGVIIAGWASNSKYSFLGAMRASAQMVSYELAMGFVLVTVLLVAGTLNMTGIVERQNTGIFADRGLAILSWNWLPLLPLFVIYVVSSIAETNRHPFDVVEGESEIVAGHMVEYSGMTFAIFFLGEYANMILLSMMATIMFLGGWAAPGGPRAPARCRVPGMDGRAVGLVLAVRQGLLRRVALHLVPRLVPALSLRPDHAARLEGVHSDHAGLAGRRRGLDADAVEHLEVS